MALSRCAANHSKAPTATIHHGGLEARVVGQGGADREEAQKAGGESAQQRHQNTHRPRGAEGRSHQPDGNLSDRGGGHAHTAAEASYRLVDDTYERLSLAVTSNLHRSGYEHRDIPITVDRAGHLVESDETTPAVSTLVDLTFRR